MDLLKVGKVIGKLEGLISKIDCGTFVTKKNSTNESVKRQSLKLLNELQESLKG